MPDPIFGHPRLAAVYDAFDGARNDLDPYLAVVEELGAHSVIDVGCGTGNLAVRLAERGHAVVGVDPAEESLIIARSKPEAEKVTWIQGDASKLPAVDADLAVMTGNVAQVFLTDEDWSRTLRGIHAALRPGGRFVFEIRRPDFRVWEVWSAETETVALEVPGIGIVERRRRVTEVSLPFVSFRYTYTFSADGAVVVSDTTLWFRERADIEASLTAQGFRVLDVRDAPDRPGREYVFITER